MTPNERVQRLVQAGTITHDDGVRLLTAMGPKRPLTTLEILFDPFERFGGGTAAAIGLLTAAASLISIPLKIRYDGFLDLHTGPATSLRLALSEQFVVWILPAILFYTYARLVKSPGRIIDYLGMVGLSRIPYLLATALLGLFPSGETPRGAALVAIAAIALTALGWTITLLYKGFKNASGLTGAKLVAGFIATMVVCEAMSKTVLGLVE